MGGETIDFCAANSFSKKNSQKHVQCAGIWSSSRWSYISWMLAPCLQWCEDRWSEHHKAFRLMDIDSFTIGEMQNPNTCTCCRSVFALKVLGFLTQTYVVLRSTTQYFPQGQIDPPFGFDA